MISRRLNDVVFKQDIARSKAGDFVSRGEERLSAMFRDLTGIQQDSQEQVDADAMVWVNPKALGRSDIIRYEDEFFQVQRVVNAKRFHVGPTLFTKCYLKKSRDVKTA